MHIVQWAKQLCTGRARRCASHYLLSKLQSSAGHLFATGFAGPCLSSRTPGRCWCRHTTALHSKFACTQTGWYFVFKAKAPLTRADVSCQMQARLGCRSQASLCQEPVQCSATTELKTAKDLCKDNTVRYNVHLQALFVSIQASHLKHCWLVQVGFGATMLVTRSPPHVAC